MGEANAGVFDTFRLSEERGVEHSDTAGVIWAAAVIECFEASRMDAGFYN